MADERVETGCLSDADPICYVPNKCGSLQPRIQASLRAQVAGGKFYVPLPRDEADFTPDYSY